VAVVSVFGDRVVEDIGSGEVLDESMFSFVMILTMSTHAWSDDLYTCLMYLGKSDYRFVSDAFYSILWSDMIVLLNTKS